MRKPVLVLFLSLVFSLTASASALNTGTDKPALTRIPVKSEVRAPAAPGSLVAVVTKAMVDLTWKDNAGNESGFKIEKRTGSGGRYTEVKAVGPGITKFTDSDVKPGFTYYYRVKAVTTDGGREYSSPYSNEAIATIPASQTPPPSPPPPPPPPFTAVNLTVPGELTITGKAFTAVDLTVPGELTIICDFTPIDLTVPGELTIIYDFTPIDLTVPGELTITGGTN